MSEIHQIVIVALLSAFVVLFIGKTGLREKMRNHFDSIGATPMASMLDCDFCLSFWICLAISFIFWIVFKDVSVVVPVCATPVTRYLI